MTPFNAYAHFTDLNELAEMDIFTNSDVMRVIRPVTPTALTLIVRDGLTPETPSPSHCRCGAQSAPKHTPTAFVPELRAVPELNHPYGPMAESHHYIARRAIYKQGYGYLLN